MGGESLTTEGRKQQTIRKAEKRIIEAAQELINKAPIDDFGIPYVSELLLLVFSDVVEAVRAYEELVGEE